MGTLVTATKTPVSPAQMLEALGRAWMRVFNPAPSRQAIAVLLAQWALETGNGASMICFNVGNARCPNPHSKWDYCQFHTWEMIGGKRVEGIGAFRAFATLEDGCADFLDLIHGRFGKAWPAVLSGDPVLFAHVLKQMRYYTAPEADYVAGMKARFHTFASLPESQWEKDVRFGNTDNEPTNPNFTPPEAA